MVWTVWTCGQGDLRYNPKQDLSFMSGRRLGKAEATYEPLDHIRRILPPFTLWRQSSQQHHEQVQAA